LLRAGILTLVDQTTAFREQPVKYYSKRPSAFEELIPRAAFKSSFEESCRADYIPFLSETAAQLRHRLPEKQSDGSAPKPASKAISTPGRMRNRTACEQIWKSDFDPNIRKRVESGAVSGRGHPDMRIAVQ
jgi:hypothetical protein